MLLLKDLVIGERVRLELKEDLMPVTGVYDGIVEKTGFVTILRMDEVGMKEISFVHPSFIKDIQKNPGSLTFTTRP